MGNSRENSQSKILHALNSEAKKLNQSEPPASSVEAAPPAAAVEIDVFADATYTARASAAKTKDDALLTVYYFPTLLGHIALEFENRYLSYGQNYDNMSLEAEKRIYGVEPIAIRLPAAEMRAYFRDNIDRAANKMNLAIRNAGDDYAILENNCANAVADLLKGAGYKEEYAAGLSKANAQENLFLRNAFIQNHQKLLAREQKVYRPNFIQKAWRKFEGLVAKVPGLNRLIKNNDKELLSYKDASIAKRSFLLPKQVALYANQLAMVANLRERRAIFTGELPGKKLLTPAEQITQLIYNDINFLKQELVGAEIKGQKRTAKRLGRCIHNMYANYFDQIAKLPNEQVDNHDLFKIVAEHVIPNYLANGGRAENLLDLMQVTA